MEADKLVRSLGQEKKVMVHLLRFLYGPEFMDEIDEKSIQPADPSYIPGKGRAGQADLLYRCKMKREYGGRPLFLQLLVEHKSYKDSTVLFQVGKYVYNHWDIEKMIPVVPMIFYHGKGDFLPKQLAELHPNYSEQARTSFPVIRPLFCNLSSVPIREIAKRSDISDYLKIPLMLLRGVIGGDSVLLKELNTIEKSLSTLTAKEQEELLTRCHVYLMKGTSMKHTTVEAIMNRATDKVREKLYTPEMQLRDLGIAEGMKKGKVKGIAEGMKKGRAEERLATAQKMKAEGIPLDLIRRVTGLSVKEIEAL